MDRPKRVIAKPSRYKTTSSDDGPRRTKQHPDNDIDDDIAELRRTMEQEDTGPSLLQDIESTTGFNLLSDNNPLTPHTHTYTELQTPQSYNNIYSATVSQPTHTTHTQPTHTQTTYTTFTPNYVQRQTEIGMMQPVVISGYPHQSRCDAQDSVQRNIRENECQGYDRTSGVTKVTND
ncbi:hypothetical protein DMN91_008130 [Ooceraea biroi]|uniref:Uncharacterized protein n=1 Tax=Ooceraea biroi TaxID=2015173 RepID=A0A3L8DGJ7_OOCBI|nr:hypothetical protein DMN91_008127 [Ooceraea biroi]RLU19573.1 hypothetical protein DMN91_008130 [Ooceraea biroi]